jgi:hypothetical protein
MVAAQDEHREHSVRLRDRTLDDVTVVGRSWNDRDALLNGSSWATLCSRHTPTTT